MYDYIISDHGKLSLITKIIACIKYIDYKNNLAK